MIQKTLLLLAALTVATIAHAGDRTVPTKLGAVKVFLNGAQVTRTGRAELPAGVTTVRFEGLSEEVDPGSIQVSGKGDFRILGVRHELNYLDERPKAKEIDALQQRIKGLEHQYAEKDNAKAVLQNEEQFLQRNAQISGQQQGVTLQQLQGINDYMRERMKAIKAGLLAIQDEQTALHEEATKLRAQLGQLQGVKERPTSIVLVDVSADAAVSASFTLGYIVKSAGWTPGYDIRVSSIDKPLELTYRASVYQNTGEDWDNVALTLSSGDPSRGGTMPELQPWRIDFGYRPMGGRTQAPVRPYNASIRDVRGIVRDAATGEPLPFVTVQLLDEGGNRINASTTNVEGYYAIAVPANGRRLQVDYIGYASQVLNVHSSTMNVALTASANELNDVTITSGSAGMVQLEGRAAGSYAWNATPSAIVAQNVVERATNFEFEIDMPYTIPSDGRNHHVAVQQEQLSATYRYYCTPKLDPDAFLFAKVTGWEAMNLLPGSMNIYFEGTYIGEGYLDLSSVGDTLDLSLGRDQGITVQRTKAKAICKKGFASGKRTETIAWELAVRNNKSQAIDLVITDQYPIAVRSEIEVSLDDDSGAEVDKEKGFLTWKKRIEPRTNQKWGFGYSVKYPKDQTVVLE